MKIVVLQLLLGALGVQATSQTIAQDVDESFQGSDYFFGNPGACLQYNNCSVKPLPFPGDGLKWQNLVSYAVPLISPSGGELREPGLVPIDTILGHDYYFAKYVNTSRPAIITKKYKDSHVESWELHGFDFGCSAVQSLEISPGGQNLTANAPGNCSMTIQGFGPKGRPLGTETFHYIGRVLDSAGIFTIPMNRFTTTEKGLKGKKVAKIRLTAKYETTSTKFLGPLVFGIDEVKYTLYNRTVKG